MMHYDNRGNINWAAFATLERGDTFLHNDEPYLCVVDATDENGFVRGVNLLCGWVEEFSGATPVKLVEFELNEMRNN